MGREIGARTLVSEIGQSVDLPVKARSGPRSSRLAPWWLPKAAEPTAPATAGYRPLHQVCSLQPRGRRSRGPERGGDRSVGARRWSRGRARRAERAALMK
jgi:hypothetical protein